MKKRKIRFNHSWLLTLLDLMLLMLTFFIMLYSMSSPKIKNNNIQMSAQLTNSSSLRRGVHLNYLEQILSQQQFPFIDFPIQKGKSRLSIQIPKDIFTNPQNKQLSTDKEVKLKYLGEILNNISNEMLLQVSIKNADIQDAILQAAVIANKLKEGGYTRNLRIIFQKNPTNDFIQIIIFEQTGDE